MDGLRKRPQKSGDKKRTNLLGVKEIMSMNVRRYKMTVWKWNKCGNTIPAETPPDLCPSCKQKCEYVDVTCYIPGCGGPESGSINPQVFKESEDLDR